MSESSTKSTANGVDNSGPQLTARSLRWWLQRFGTLGLFIAAGLLLIVALGLAQRLGWIGTEGLAGGAGAGDAEQETYTCPMHPQIRQPGPGRCPICGMALAPAASTGTDLDQLAVTIEIAQRRLANIQTETVTQQPVTSTIRTIGSIEIDESRQSTIASYIDGRVERLFADYTGVEVDKGDHLAVVYSPQLYSAQVEYVEAKNVLSKSGGAALASIRDAQEKLIANSRQRLVELGMTPEQMQELDTSGEAKSRLTIYSPIGGTVIEKLAEEGKYVSAGEPIYRIANLSTVWLMLELYPEDASRIRFGQLVRAELTSLPGRKLSGRVAFIDPRVDKANRTVGVRVEFKNDAGELRPGDYAQATIDIPIGPQGDVYDSELAGKWISPMHPQVIQDAPGDCPICGMKLVPTSRYGYTEQPVAQPTSITVPRSALLMAGEHSVVYVETEPGRFELRKVTLGPILRDGAIILDGVKPGEQVATSGNFLIDSQMQLAGNPSLIDPTKAEPKLDETMTEEMIAALSELSPEDRALAESQRICPVTKMPLGSMGAPPKVDVNGQIVFICCKGCEAPLLEDPQTHLANLTAGNTSHQVDPEIAAALAKLSPADRAIAQRQRICPVADFPLGSMGTPKKVDVNGTPVFICCEGCRASLLEEPGKYLAKLATAGDSQDSSDSSPMDLPPIGTPKSLEPQSGLPPIEAPQAIIEGASQERVEPVAELPMEIVR